MTPFLTLSDLEIVRGRAQSAGRCCEDLGPTVDRAAGWSSPRNPTGGQVYILCGEFVASSLFLLIFIFRQERNAKPRTPTGGRKIKI